MASSVIGVGGILVLTLAAELDDASAQELRDRTADAVVRQSARGIVIDLGAVEVLDSYLGRVLMEVAGAASLLGADTVVAGMRPAVAITLVELGLTLGGIRASLDAETALRSFGVRTTDPGGDHRMERP